MHRSKMFTPLLALASVLMVATVAWACTAQAPVQVVGPSFGPAGSTLTVQSAAGHFTGAAEIRWNSINGPLLAAAEVKADQEFSVKISVPQVSPGVYYLMLVTQNAGVAGAPFEVVAEPGGLPSSQAVQPGLGKSVESDLWGVGSGSSLALAGPATVSAASTSPALIAGFVLLVGGGLALASSLSIMAVRTKRRVKSSL